jgi:hypothetical protein
MYLINFDALADDVINYGAGDGTTADMSRRTQIYLAIGIQGADAKLQRGAITSKRNNKYCIVELANLYCFANLGTRENYSYQRTHVTTSFNRHMEHVHFHV